MKKPKQRNVIFLRDLAPRGDVQGGAAKRVFGAPPAADGDGRTDAVPEPGPRPAATRPPTARGKKKPSK